MRIVKALSLSLALAAGSSGAFAAADFTTIFRAEADLNDSTPMLLSSFALPAAIDLRESTQNSAVLDMEILGSQFPFNRAYLNPAVLGCSPNQSDANAAQAIGYLQAHTDAGLSQEWATNHITLSSALLKVGANLLLVCPRTSTGNAGAGVTGLDAIGVRNVVLQYHTTKK